MQRSRKVITAVLSVEQSEGMGAKVRRSIGGRQFRNLDPFLLLDEFRVKKTAGFPDHPHRGFETVTYMLDGKFEHEDFTGTRGMLESGDLQWMTAGKGIVHAEMPHPDADESHGLQLWVNLPKKYKMIDPKYQELKACQIPIARPMEGVEIRVMAGNAFGVNAKVFTKTEMTYLDVKMKPHTQISHSIPSNWTCFAYILSGNAMFDSETKLSYQAHYAIVFGNGNDESHIHIETTENSVHLVLLAAEPINETIVQYGPFVMNSEEEIRQTIVDYQEAKNGFEKSHSWKSAIGNR